MKNVKIPFLILKVAIFTILIFQTLNCEKKKDYDDGDFFAGLLLYNLALDPVCSSFTPETAVTISDNASNGFPDYYGNISTAPSVPPGKQCYFKFTPSSAGTNCTANCKIGLRIVKHGSDGTSANLSCSGTGLKAINKCRFDETGISFSSISTPCYMLFVSPKSTTMSLTQTRTDSGGTTPTMTLSVSAVVINSASAFTSASTTTSTTAANLNGLVTPAGSGRYIEAKFSPEPSGFTFRMTNSY